MLLTVQRMLILGLTQRFKRGEHGAIVIAGNARERAC